MARRFAAIADELPISRIVGWYPETSAAVLVQDGVTLWQHAARAALVVRSLSEAFIQDYLDQDWPEVSYCVGVFRLEGPGVQLFNRIEGDHFTILGLPLLPLLGALRERGVLAS